jgi:DNA-binding SARP family transcriptional activator
MQLHLAAAPRIVLPDGSTRELSALDGALLAWLALEGPTPRARLAALLWPDSDAEAARNSLRQRLFRLKRQLGMELVSGTAWLALMPGMSHDLEEADDVLADVDESFGPEYTQWLAQQRQRRRQRVS